MATDPSFAATPAIGAALLGVNESNLQTPAVASVILTAGASGTRIEEVVINATASGLVATTAAGLVYLFLYDGSTYHLFDVVSVPAITASGTAAGFRARNVYANLILKSGWSLRAAQNGNSGLIKVIAFGGDF